MSPERLQAAGFSTPSPAIGWPGSAATARLATRPSPTSTSSCYEPPASRQAAGGRLIHTSRGDLDDIAQEAADDALLAVLARLDDFRGLSPLHDLGVQVRAATTPPSRCGVAPGRDRRSPLDDEGWTPVRELRPRAARGGRAERAARCDPHRHRRGTHPAPAARPRRARAERGPDRRAGRAAADNARCALQDVARRSAKAAATPGGVGSRASSTSREEIS